MTSRTLTTRTLAVVAIAVLALSACSSDSPKAGPATSAADVTTTQADEPATTNAPPVDAVPNADGSVTVRVTVGTDDFETTGGKRVVGIKQGAAVTIELVDSSTDQSYHLHGYDIETESARGTTARISFTATKTGQFDLESHTTEQTLLVLFVS